MAPWSRLPYEVQKLIVVEAVNTPDVFSAPSALFGILLLSREVHDTLLGAPERGIPAHNDLFLQLYESRFDSAAPNRRLAWLARGGKFTPDIFAVVFKQRCILLREIRSGEWFRRIQSGELDRESFERALWEVYLMLLEDDGKNRAQLESAGIEGWLRDIILLFSEAEKDDDGWPIETIVLQLAAASFAIVSDRASAIQEGKSVNGQLIDALESFFFGCHRYPHAPLPLTWFNSHHISDMTSIPPDSLRTMDTMPVSETYQLEYFCYHLTLTPPPLACSAAIIITNRHEQEDIGFLPSLPANRAEADARNFAGATKEDWQKRNLLRKLAIGVETPRVGSGRENLAGLENPATGSERWDYLFNRMRAVGYILDHPSRPLASTWFDTMYKPGMFTGNWLGRLVFPDSRIIQRMYEMHPAPLSEVRETLGDHELGVYVNFFQATLREHISTEYAVGCELAPGHGVQNGYFPIDVDPSLGRNVYENATELVVNDPLEPDPAWAIKRYETYHTGMSLPPALPPPKMKLADSRVKVPDDVEMDFEHEGVGSNGRCIDIILTGETDDEYGKAWGEYTFYGRVRMLDGLIVLVRPPRNPDPNFGQGRWIFSGCMYMADTIVGNWRDTNADVHSAGLQAPFIISKVGPGSGLSS